MARFVALLRGMNVGGHRVSGQELVAIFKRAGMSEASTWRASGNVVFEAPPAGEEAITEALERTLEADLGYAVPVLLRDGPQLRRLVAATLPGDGARSGKPQVIFLRRPPNPDEVVGLLGLAGPDEALQVLGRDVLWLPKGGLLDADLDLVKVERLLSPTTVRTMNTVREVTDRFFGPVDD